MKRPTPKMLVAGGVALLSLALFGVALFSLLRDRGDGGLSTVEGPTVPSEPTLDRFDYDRRLARLAHMDVGTGTDEGKLWPAESVYPEYGAILPFKRIVAYYGNFYSRGMGVLGEYVEETMLEMLAREVAAWEEADPETPVQPAIDYIAVVAQAGAGRDGKYRLRMPDKEIDKAIAMAEKIDGIVILEVQSGLADLQGEIKALEKYLVLPQVHLAIDPEFNMKYGGLPGQRVGSVDATDVNAAIGYLSGLVQAGGLPPKVLIVHRYTRPMVTNATGIEPTPEVQVVMDMDGWGPPWQKFGSYNSYIVPYPVQFTGFKIFYKNDRLNYGLPVLTPAEILDLTPQPVFIQYQ
ncbi:MAG: hypothetical protein U9Q03_04850 [Patescibacteria group bacterium]|nr:hypothetical protein [Patescibacteria group bacterium]